MSPTKQLVLASAGSSSLDKAAPEYARRFLAGPVRVLEGVDLSGFRDEIRRLDRSGPVCAAVSADTLLAWRSSEIEDGSGFPPAPCREILIFGWDDRPRHSEALRSLTGGGVRGVATGTSPGGDIQFPDAPGEIPAPFSGLQDSMGREIVHPFFDLGGGKGAVPLMDVGEGPVLVRVDRGETRMFLIAGSLADPNTPLTIRKGIGAYYESLIPFLFFLRAAFPETCWRGADRGSRLIIDDPLIRLRYGHLEYQDLLDSMDRAGFGASIAFIPWNHRRTGKKAADRLFPDPARFSVCIHGCDHTRDEFGTRDRTILRQKAHVALERMESHRRRTGIDHENIMVFPQGSFSAEAMGALGEADFLAAVDSNCLPRDEYEGGRITLEDLLSPAVTRFSGFPVFKRFYPDRMIDFAFGLFLGRPALVTAHHHDFRDGGARLEGFMAGLAGLTRVGPMTLTEQLTGARLERDAPDGAREIRFFTREFTWKNPRKETVGCRFQKPEPYGEDVAEVLVGGRPFPHEVQDGLLVFETRLEPEEEVRVRVKLKKPPPPRLTSPGVGYRARVAARRYLSEFRDHTLAGHPRLAKLAASVARATGLVSKPS